MTACSFSKWLLITVIPKEIILELCWFDGTLLRCISGRELHICFTEEGDSVTKNRE